MLVVVLLGGRSGFTALDEDWKGYCEFRDVGMLGGGGGSWV